MGNQPGSPANQHETGHGPPTGSRRLFWNTVLLFAFLSSLFLIIDTYTSLGKPIESLIALPGALALLPHVWKGLSRLNINLPFSFDAIARAVSSYLCTAILAILLIGTAGIWLGLGAVKVKAPESGSGTEYEVAFQSKTKRANTASGEHIFGPYWVGWGGNGQACLTFPEYPLQLVRFTARETREFYFPSSIKWPVIVIQGSRGMLDYFPRNHPEMAVHLSVLAVDGAGRKMTAKVNQYTGGLVCLGCPAGVKLPEQFLEASTVLWHKSKNEVSDKLTLQLVFVPASCTPVDVFHAESLTISLTPQPDSRCPAYGRTISIANRFSDTNSNGPCRIIVDPDNPAGGENPCAE